MSWAKGELTQYTAWLEDASGRTSRSGHLPKYVRIANSMLDRARALMSRRLGRKAWVFAACSMPLLLTGCYWSDIPVLQSGERAPLIGSSTCSEAPNGPYNIIERFTPPNDYSYVIVNATQSPPGSIVVRYKWITKSLYLMEVDQQKSTPLNASGYYYFYAEIGNNSYKILDAYPAAMPHECYQQTGSPRPADCRKTAELVDRAYQIEYGMDTTTQLQGSLKGAPAKVEEFLLDSAAQRFFPINTCTMSGPQTGPASERASP